MRRALIIMMIGLVIHTNVNAQNQGWKGKFEQLDQLLPTPNSYRNGSGGPGINYWQQRADYVIDVEVDDNTQLIKGTETITYYNNSPDQLSYLWLQLDQNLFTENSTTNLSRTGNVRDGEAARNFISTSGGDEYKGGYKIDYVKDANGKPLTYVINNTMMRVDLPVSLKTGENVKISIAWSYTEKDRNLVSIDRGGFEYFPQDKNYIYTCAQWFPRMCVYDDYEGWQNKQYLGQGEFALNFGNYRVRITVPSDHIVGATGTIQNMKEVLTTEQISRYEKAKTSYDRPVFIVTKEEAAQKEKVKSTKKSTWEFYAENVRDFAFASSRKFIWEVQAVKLKDKRPLAMSLYPKEGNPLWERESTKAVKNALEIYSERSIEYPYPVAYSVHTADQGMEYPMICFNGGRPNASGNYSDQTRYGMVMVIVHEVGHNFFPMIVNSDERQWSWMDEGLNTFLEKETIETRYPDLAWGNRGTPTAIVPYMRGEKSQMRPIMSMSDNIRRTEFGSNAYMKPSGALTILRETVIGPELFDKAFKEYAERWAFKHPKPADFFRTMEDASGVDLDWFWRGWFYGTDHVDVDLANVKWYILKSSKPDVEKSIKVRQGGSLSSAGNSGEAKDFSNGPQEFIITRTPASLNGEFRSSINDDNVRARLEGKNIYELTFRNAGGLVTPLVIQWMYIDGSKEIERIPAEIWRTNENQVTKVFYKDKEVVNIIIDPYGELADAEDSNNVFPRRGKESKFEQFKKNK